MAGKKNNLSTTTLKSLLEQIGSRLNLLIDNDMSRIFDIDGFLVKEVSSSGIVSRLYLKCLFFNEEGNISGDFQTKRHDGDGFIWGRELSFLNSEDLKRIMSLLQSFDLPETDKFHKESRWGLPAGIGSLIRMQRRNSSVSHHV